MTDSLHTIHLESVPASVVRNVNLYPTRAEITRVFKFAVKAGQNQVVIDGLPRVMEKQSLRVDGVGDATIHDVTISNSPTPPVPPNSALDALHLEKERVQKALERSKRSQTSLENLFGSMNIQHINVENLGNIMRSYDTAGEELDEKIIELEGKMKEVDAKIELENQKTVGLQHQSRSGYMRVSVAVFATVAGDVELVLTYACNGLKQSWKAGYDIRVDMTASEKQVTLLYKAIVTQETGETWENVPLTLDTTVPTSGAKIPSLAVWRIVERPNSNWYKKAKAKGPTMLSASVDESRPASSQTSISLPLQEELGLSLLSASVVEKGERLDSLASTITSKGHVNATFRVPGLVTIPSEDTEHTFTIAELKLDAAITWATAPKKEARVIFKAKITNSSEYMLLDGRGNVYVDGSYISQIDVPLVSPFESFDCPLGYDPTVRVTYNDIRKKESTSGFYSKTKEHLFTQNITIHNTKNRPVPALKVIDQIPVSEVSGVKVRLINPPLTVPDPTAGSNGVGADSNAAAEAGDDEVTKPTAKRSSVATLTTSSANKSMSASQPSAPKVKVSEGVIAQWDRTDEPGVELETLGSDGMINWICAIPAQSTTDLVLQYEIRVPAKMTVSFSGFRQE